ncbi:MAG: ribose 5-phosphate isomerase B [Lachnospiraceae bacterium]|nr:ribose 5-phosphate isomerase B [Lachnospiraceae bacterium]MDE6185203.1 ribose 5-phosphate isomerase B [Lachnospiraceae bacterium]MDE7287340.1 ribose 5-phosphate isomerase B [Lachnospiraceae bacterium]
MIALGSDHGGYELKCHIMEHLKEREIPYQDFGCYDLQSCDYPDFGKAAARAVADGRCERGIVVCTTGIGISIAANKVAGVRCALCTDPYLAKMTRLHNDANVLALGGGFTGKNLAIEIVDTFLDTEFSEGENHVRRVGKLENTD